MVPDWAAVWFTIIAGLITLAVLSFLYKDNPLYKLAEHIAVGISVGFMIITQYYNVFLPKVWGNILDKGRFDYLIPTALGFLLFSRFVPKYGWLSRLSLAFMIGAAAGVNLPQVLEGRVLKQFEGSLRPLIQLVPGNSSASLIGSLSALFLVFGTLACLLFFLFSVEHKGGLGRVAYFGRLCIMAGFGASFGCTVTSRVSLLIGRVQYLTHDFVQAIGGLF